jgi:DegV family protein with EDD domain
MSKVAIVTDSTAYIPDDKMQGLEIYVAPQILIWGDKTYEDGVDITPVEFYTRLANASVMPSSSQVSPQKFLAIFNDLLSRDFQILAILISEKLSGTIASAVQAKETLGNVPIEIVDAQTTAMALGYLDLMTARAAAQGASLAECKAYAEANWSNTGVVFAVDTLEFLHRGGRIGGASRLLGTALGIKPILEIREGVVEAVDKVRTRKKSLARVLELIGQKIDNRKPLHLATLHANSKDDAVELLNMAKEQLGGDEFILAEVSPVVGTHAGPGTVGLAFLAG